MKLLRVALPVPVYRDFDYLAPEDRLDARGHLVRVRIGQRRVLGVVVGNPLQTEVPFENLVAIDGYADELPRVPYDVLELAEFAAGYYQFPLGMTLQHAVPPRGRRANAPSLDRRPASYRLSAAGTDAMRALASRAHRQRALAEAFAGGNALSRMEALKIAPGSTLRRWLGLGWIAPVEPDPGASGAPTLRLPELTPTQQAALAEIEHAAGRFETLLLHGVTGSGKTEVYLASAAATISRGGQVLILVPEINLTPQLAERIRRALPECNIVLLHSHLPELQRLEAWKDAASGRAQLVLGTRLAIFAPLPKLGLIVVDEENDLSYKQQDGLRYNARDLAVYRARIRGIPVVLGSATPALETLAHARRGHYRLLTLPHRPAGGAMPTIRLIPQRQGRSSGGGLTAPLIAAVQSRLEKGEQSLLFINRRGFAPSLLCVACAWAASCSRCSARLVVHLTERRLRCHHCGEEHALPNACPSCGNQDLLPLGFGTQRLEAALRETFGDARIARVDADSTRRKGTWRTLLTSILDGELDILIGTQMMVKGHDFPRLTLVGILGADNALYSADFRATERLYAQLTQVAGRAGRAELPGEVLIQTDFPAHPVYRSLVAQDDAYADALLAERRQLGLPPFARLALLRAEARQRETTERFLAKAHDQAARIAREIAAVRVSPPVAARLARRAGFERGHVLVQSAHAAGLHEFFQHWRPWLSDNAPRTLRWSIDVDPQDID